MHRHDPMHRHDLATTDPHRRHARRAAGRPVRRAFAATDGRATPIRREAPVCRPCDAGARA